MNSLSERFKQARLKAGLSQEEVAKITGMSQNAIHKIESGGTRNTRFILPISQALGVAPEWLQYGKEYPVKTMSDVWTQQSGGTVPILEWSEIIQWLTNDATPLDMNEEKREFVPNPVIDQPQRERIFAVRTKNDTMATPSGNTLTFPIGTILIADPSLNRKFGAGHFIIGYRSGSSEPIFRQCVLDGDKAYLRPLNPQYPTEEMGNDFMVLGVVIARLDALV